MIYTDVKNLQWADEQNTTINCDVFFTQFNNYLPFTASPNDPESYGVEIFNDCVAGVYGEIAPYVKPIPTAEQNKNTAISLLSQTDWTTIPDVADPALSNPYLSNQKEFISFRNEVRQISINPVAGNLDWKSTPNPVWQSV
jgi:hypothetical protein